MSQDTAKNVLIRRSAQISAAAELAAESTNDWQVIQAVMTRRIDDLQLTEQQEAKLKRYQFIYNQLASGKYSEEEVRELYQSTYKLSYVQARSDMRDSRELFSATANINKLFEVKVQLELNRKWTQMAIAKGDLRAASQFDKNRQKLLAMLPDAEDSAAEDFQPHTNVITFNPELLGLKPMDQADLRQLVTDIKSQFGGSLDIGFITEEIDYEEVKGD